MESLTVIKPNFSTLLHLWWLFLGCAVFVVLGYFLIKTSTLLSAPTMAGWLGIIVFGGGLVVVILVTLINFIHPTLRMDAQGLTPGFIDLRYFPSATRKTILWEDIDRVSVGQSEVATNISTRGRWKLFWPRINIYTNSEFNFLTIHLKHPEKYNLPDSPKMYDKPIEATTSITEVGTHSRGTYKNFGDINLSNMILPGGDSAKVIEAFKKYPVRVDVGQ